MSVIKILPKQPPKEVDIDKIRIFGEILKNDSEYKIPVNAHITTELLDYLCEIHKDVKISNLFKLHNDNEKQVPYEYQVDVICNTCGNLVTCEFNKGNLISYLETRHFKCELCKHQELIKHQQENKEIFESLKEQREKEQAELEKQKECNTINFINQYLNINTNIVYDLTTAQRFWQMCKINIYWDKVNEYIRTMYYYDFLKTPYWKIVTDYVKLRSDYRCQLCGNNKNLVTHHRTYEHNGCEHSHLEDLIVLCKDCHEKFHDICTE